MRQSSLLPALFALIATSAWTQAQDFDPVKAASGWSRLDIDGSSVFLVPGGKALQVWSREGGLTDALDLSKAGLTPEKWVLDSRRNAWLVAGTSLQWLERSGKPGKKEGLPAEVGDIAWDAKGFVISYRTAAPYLEKRDYKSGSVIWSFGSRPKPEEASARTLHRIAVNDEGAILLMSGSGFSIQVLDGTKGKPVGESVFTFRGGGAPPLELGSQDRGPMAWWLSHEVAFAAVPGSQAPWAGMQGLLLARMDFAKATLEFLPTGAPEDHFLLGVTDTDAILMNPKGGLVFVRLR